MTDKQDFKTFARDHLNDSLDDIDGITRTRLSAIRSEAVSSRPPKNNWFMLASLTTATAALMLIWVVPQQQSKHDFDTTMTNIALEDINILASDIDVELLEDVEFYQWLENSKHAS